MLNDATGLWQVRRQFAYPNEGATAATRYLLTESRSKIAGFTADETQRTYSVDALGNWQQQVTEERVAGRLRRFSRSFKLEPVGYGWDVLAWFQDSCGPLSELGAATGALSAKPRTWGPASVFDEKSLDGINFYHEDR